MANNHTSLATKWRPQKWEDVCGQHTVVSILKYQIETETFKQAYLLCGKYGSGKTTIARLLARSINGNNHDIIEIDAASNNGVEQVRAISEEAHKAPLVGKFKIFLVDECHLTSAAGWGAWLKLIEEPPQTAIFIFATTEIRKVPITILSRCQRFDLRRLSFDEIKEHISNICKKEGYEAEDGALSILASFSEGSARDSLSLLDRALSHNNYEKLLTEKSVSEMLGLSSKKNIYDLFISMLEGDVNKALTQFENIYSYSLDISALMQDLLNVNHNMIMAKTLNNFFETVHLPSDQVEIIKNTSQKLNISSLLRVWKLLLKGESELKNNFDAKKIMDMIIVNVCYGSRLPTLSEVLNKQNLENQIIENKSQENNAELIENITNLFDGAKVL